MYSFDWSNESVKYPAASCDDDDDDVHLNKLQRKVLQNLFSTWIMQTSQYGISKENKPVDRIASSGTVLSKKQASWPWPGLCRSTEMTRSTPIYIWYLY
jgi:hypothetical protein